MEDVRRVLIVGEPTDAHVAAVMWWLQMNDLPFETISTRAFPATELSSASVGARDEKFTYTFSSMVATPCQIAGVWNRRRPLPEPRINTHQADKLIVRQQSILYLLNLLQNIAPGSLWVNSLESQRLADQKLTALEVAKTCGFRIPETLASNDPVAIRQFAERHRWNLIAKNFVQAGWIADDGRLTVMRTSALTREQLSDDEAIAKCPMIYQPLIEKMSEWRVTVIGNAVFSFEITSLTASRPVDWRTDEKMSNLRFVPCKLPEGVAQSCLALCRRLGLVFGCIDILKLRDGSCIFLEINEGGQFLWLEEMNPDVPLLDTFGRLLCSSILGGDTRPPLRLEAYHDTDDWHALLRRIQDGSVNQSADSIVQE